MVIRVEHMHSASAVLHDGPGIEKLTDLCLRRTMMGMLGQLTPALLSELNEILSTEQNWSSEQATQELAATKAYLAEHHSLRLT